MERLREPRVAAVVGLVLAGVIIALLLSGGGDDGEPESSAARGPEEVSVDELQQLPGEVDHAVYWAGERPDTKYELKVDEGETLHPLPRVRHGGRLGRGCGLHGRTYPFSDAYGALKELAKKPGAINAATRDGAQVVTNEGNPTSVYIAYPGSDYQIEVYDPDAATALRIATSGQIKLIE